MTNPWACTNMSTETPHSRHIVIGLLVFSWQKRWGSPHWQSHVGLYLTVGHRFRSASKCIPPQLVITSTNSQLYSWMYLICEDLMNVLKTFHLMIRVKVMKRIIKSPFSLLYCVLGLSCPVILYAHLYVMVHNHSSFLCFHLSENLLLNNCISSSG